MANRINNLNSQLSGISTSENAILYEVVDNSIALITLNRPSRLNALTQEMQVQYFNALEKARDDHNVKAIIVTGAGRSFCAGADFDMLKNIGNDNTMFKASNQTRNLAQIQALTIPKPIIAAINGPCAGLGFVLATMADIRFSILGAKFTTAFAQRGLVAEYGVSFTLPKIVGISNAMDLLLSSRVFLAEEAKQIGLVQRNFNSQQELMSGTLNYVKQMISTCSPASLAAMKHQIYKDSNLNFQQAHENAMRLMEGSFEHPDSKEGVQSYLEKRQPVFQGLKYGLIDGMSK